MSNTNSSFFVILVFFTAVTCLNAQKPEPVMDYAALMTAFDVHPSGRLMLENDNAQLSAVFLPPNEEVEAVVTRKGSKSPLHIQDFYLNRTNKTFTTIKTAGKYKEFKFKDTGDYVLTYKTTSGKAMTQIPFSVITKTNDDQFDPKTIWYAQGPWSELSYLYYKLDNKENANLEFRMWAQRQAFESGRDTDIYKVFLKKDGDTIAVASDGYVGTQDWLHVQFQMRHPKSKGGRMFSIGQLSSQDGMYQFVVNKNDELYAVFPLEVKNGKPVLHPRQANNYQPRSEYIIPRFPNLKGGNSDPANTVWMERLSKSEAANVATDKPAEVAGPTEDQLKRWNWLPTSIDPNRDFKMNVTDIESRTDTGLAVGEDLIVFGTGYPNGVQYIKAGDTKPREIPEGETFSSTVFCVCGTKIVLTKRSQVAVFDTETGQLTKIPESEISLYDPKNRLFNGSGYLVATVNKATTVTERNIIKVIDVSGDKPFIIPIKNGEYTHDQVTSVSVDAKNGVVAVSSRHNKKIYAAKVAAMADQHVFDVANYKGVGDFQITIEDEVVTYADEDWRVRQLKLGENPITITEEPIGRSGNGFWVRKGRVVAVTKNDKVGSRYPMMVTDSNKPPRLVNGTGTTIPGTSAKLGLGGSAAIAIDKSVFIAGTPRDSIGVGERLQLLTDNGWLPIMGDDGKPIWGSQVVTSIGLMAMKVRNADGKTVLGFATYGQRISAAAVLASDSSSPKRNRFDAKNLAPIEFADDNPYNTHDEILESSLETYLQTEKQIAEAYLVAFGKEAGAKKTVEAVVDAMKNNGQAELVDTYLRISKHVEDKDRPSEQQSSGTRMIAAPDHDSVMAALTGQWKAIRFSAKGKDLPDEAIENLQLTFANGNFVMNMGPELQTGTYAVNVNKSPTAMTIGINSGDKKGQKRYGSFKLLKHNRLLVVFGTDESTFPTRFVPDKSGETIMAVYQKQ